MHPSSEPARPLSPADTLRWLPPALLPLGAAIAAHAVLAPGSRAAVPSGVLSGLGAAALWGLVLVGSLVVVTGAVLLVHRLRGLPRVRPTAATAVVALFLLLTSLSTRLPPLPFWDGLERNWQGKLLDLLWVGILVLVLRRWAREEAGLRWRIVPGSARPALLVVLGVLTVFVALGAVAVLSGESAARPVDLEQVLWDATVPNLTEELIWRGAMLAVLDRALPARRRVLGAGLGWGTVITAVLFGVGHMVLLGADGAWSLSIGGGVFALVMGLALAWIRARTGSIWPAFALHCAPELGADIGVLPLR
ncbi:lysostaphin resistance A-like protein [Brachybacterium sp. AOP43-C2-M15]|uniref:lysostaphin resistance A-like protein n=1 Tax=Brachybacterium sp. AOP43-C2-M15 TaxID=3457661 RepID=UPI004034732B